MAARTACERKPSPLDVSIKVAVGVVCGRVICSMLDFRSILASTPIRESRMRLTIHLSPSSFDNPSVFERSLMSIL